MEGYVHSVHTFIALCLLVIVQQTESMVSGLAAHGEGNLILSSFQPLET